jgi:hypothetical protein
MKKYILLVSLMFTSLGHSFTLGTDEGSSFRVNLIPVHVSNTPCEYLEISSDELMGLANEAFRKYWNSVKDTRLKFYSGGILDVSTAGTREEVFYRTPPESILIGCNAFENPDFELSLDEDFITSVYAITRMRHILNANILIQDSERSKFAQLTRDEKVARLAHEIGHALGLGHSESSQALMYGSKESFPVELSHDDIEGMKFLYPMTQE